MGGCEDGHIRGDHGAIADVGLPIGVFPISIMHTFRFGAIGGFVRTGGKGMK